MDEKQFIEMNDLKYINNNLYYKGMFRIWIDDKIHILFMSKILFKSEGLRPDDFLNAQNILSANC